MEWPTSLEESGDFRRDQAMPVAGRGAVLLYGDDPRRRQRAGIGENHRAPQARSTATTPLTFWRAFMTPFSCCRSWQTKEKRLTARPSSLARQLASLMLMPWAMKLWPTLARMPGRLAV